MELAGKKVIQNIFAELFTVWAMEKINALHFFRGVLANLQVC